MPSKKRKKGKKKTIVLTIISLGIIVVSTYVFSTYFLKIYNIYKEKKELTAKIAELSDKEEKLKSEVQKLKDKMAKDAAGDVLSNAVDVNGIKVLPVKLEDVDMNALRTLGDDMKAKLGKSIITRMFLL